MHNLHFMVVPAEDGADACSTVETEIEEWGNENNWRHISGAVSQDNEVHVGDDEGRFMDGLDTIDKINKEVRVWVKGENMYTHNGKKLVKRYLDGKKLTSQEWWRISQWAEKQSQNADIGKPAGKFNVLEDTYFPYKYDENGVTRSFLCDNVEPEQKLWVVFIDMHS